MAHPPAHALRIRLECRDGPKALDVGAATFSTALPLAEAEALLCDWAPTRSLVRFRGPRAWYCGEPIGNPRICAGRWQRAWRWAFRTLEPHQLLHFSNPDPRYALPAITHWWDLTCDTREERLPRAIAVISNAGGSPRRWWPEIALRNRFAMTPRVDLFGQAAGWRRAAGGWPWSRALPATYQGPLPGAWHTPEKVLWMARYQVAVVLENSYLPGYFTEKLVDAARSGCIPIYRAHPSLRQGVLREARWVDPADFGLDPQATLAYALAQDRRAYAEANARWLERPEVAATHGRVVFARIAEILGASTGARAT